MKWGKDPPVMTKKTPFYEVARVAGVSPATVTRVAKGNPRVDPETRMRVRRAASELGVDLEEASRSRMLAFVLANRDVLHGFQSRVLIGAERFCASHGWELVFLSLDYSPGLSHKELNLPQIVRRSDTVRGVILGGMNYPNFLCALSERGITFSVLGNNVVGEWPSEAYDVVWTDDVGGSAEMTEHLAGLGHQDIWFIGNRQLPWFHRAAEGYRRGMTAAGLEPRFSDVNADSRELGYLAAKMILSRRERVTAVFAGSDQVAHGVYKALAEFGVRVPNDISVAGLNDTEGVLLNPPLTTIREFPEALGGHLAQFAIQRIQNPGLPPQQMTLPTELLKRESCLPPAGMSELAPAPGHAAADASPAKSVR